MAYLPNRRVSFHDRDNFVRDLMTILTGNPECGGDAIQVPSPLTHTARDLAPVVPVEDVKHHLRIEPEVTDDDGYLTGLEMAARLHTENVLRRSIDETVGENVKLAMLLLIAHWYRNRESVGDNKLVQLPLAYMALLAPERDYPLGTY